MALLGNLILRIFMIMIALTFAFAAAGAFVGFGFYNEIISADPPIRAFDQQILTLGSIIVALVSTTLIGFYSIGLIMGTLVLAEVFGWKSLVGYLALSGIIVLILAGVNFSDAAVSISQDAVSGNGALMVSLSAGFIAGFTYWLIAGRNAGNWLKSLRHQDLERKRT